MAGEFTAKQRCGATDPISCPPPLPSSERGWMRRHPFPPVPLAPPPVSSQWFAPASLAEAISVMRTQREIVLFGGGTGREGVAKYYDGRSRGGEELAIPPALLSLAGVAELCGCEVRGGGWHAELQLGAALPLERPFPTRKLTRSIQLAFTFTSTMTLTLLQVRSVGTLGGNLVLWSTYGLFPSDLALLLTTLRATATVVDTPTGSKRCVPIAALPAVQWAHGRSLLTTVTIPPPSLESGEVELVYTFKVALRRQNAHALLNAGFALVVDQPAGCVVRRATVCYGGVSQHAVVRAVDVEGILVGSRLGDDRALLDVMQALGPVVRCLDPKFKRTELRASLLHSLLYKALLLATKACKLPLAPRLSCAATLFSRPPSSGRWEVEGGEDESIFPISQPTHKLSAMAQCTGEAKYTADLPLTTATLHGALVLARSLGYLRGVDASKAMAVEGVRAVITAADLKACGFNLTLSAGVEEEVLASHTLPYVGARVALVLATSSAVAERAARLVELSTTPLDRKPILSIAEAVAAGSFFPTSPPHTLSVGDAAKALSTDGVVVVEGEASCGHQHHFHMETQTAVASLDESGGVVIELATQDPHSVAASAAHVLNLPTSRVEARMRRAGGGFGGKASRSIPGGVLAACAAVLSRSSVRLILPLNENLDSLGSRRPHAFLFKAAATPDGRITAVTGVTYAMQGWCSDMGGLTMAFDLSRAIDGPYSVPNWEVRGVCCRTDTPSNTFTRGPFHLPAALLLEAVVERVAHCTGISASEVRERNLYHKGDVTPYGQTIPTDNLRACVSEARARCRYEALAAEVEHFNKTSRYVKQGLAVGPFKFGVGKGWGYGAVVRVDVLQCELHILRAEVVTDQGSSLNPTIDAGQVQGAYTMGLGYVLTEAFEWGEDGSNLTNGTWEYKPPSSQDIPIVFNVSFIKNATNKFGVFGSKAVGEPAVLASTSIVSAVRHALSAVRADEGILEQAMISPPLTPDVIAAAAALDHNKFGFTVE
ncbi:MAG: hypothetical protein SGPRY_005889 [Prymnesium sp.]